jgi:hypothetical protein
MLAFYSIPRSRQNPKIFWVDNAKITGDGIAKVSPVLGDFVTQEIERGIRELPTCRMAFVVGDVSVHEAQNRSIGFIIRQAHEQLGPAPWPGEPFPHGPRSGIRGVMIARCQERHGRARAWKRAPRSIPKAVSSKRRRRSIPRPSRFGRSKDRSRREC